MSTQRPVPRSRITAGHVSDVDEEESEDEEEESDME
jgi:hypothetical protein